MIPTADVAELDTGSLRDLIAWRPPLGVLSLYVSVDPADRSGAWRIAAHNGLSRARDDAGRLGNEAGPALIKTADRIQAEIDDESERPPRGLVAFAEIADAPGEVRSFASQLAPRSTEVHHSERPWLGPLVLMLDDGTPTGIAAISAEHIRLFDWRFGHAEELREWQLELYLGQWRERKAQSPSNPASGQAISASGRDQHDQRMEANRERFARDSGALAKADAGARGWQRLLTFGDQRYCERFTDGLNGVCDTRFAGDADIAAQPTHLISERADAARATLRGEFEKQLLARLDESAFADGRVSFGRPETMQALEQGRVEHLVYDGRGNGLEIEQMIELAIPTGARITPITGAAAADLEPRDGVAALLRY